MADRDAFKKYVEAAAVLGRVTRARAEEIARELVDNGEVQRGQAQQWVDDLVERSRRASDDLVKVVRSEVKRQLDSMRIDPEHLAGQVADILRQSAAAGRKATGGATVAARSTVKRAAARRPTAKKAAVPTGTPTKRAAVKKAAVKRVPVKKAPAKKTVARKAPAKKTVAKKASS
jgi:polyhydroxyalkanoate synthesis regulator phasin